MGFLGSCEALFLLVVLFEVEPFELVFLDPLEEENLRRRDPEELRCPVVALRDPEEGEDDKEDGRVRALVLLRRLIFSEERREPEEVCDT